MIESELAGEKPAGKDAAIWFEDGDIQITAGHVEEIEEDVLARASVKSPLIAGTGDFDGSVYDLSVADGTNVIGGDLPELEGVGW